MVEFISILEKCLCYWIVMFANAIAQIMIEEVTWYKSSFLLLNILQNMQALQLNIINIKTESIYKLCQASLGRGT